jgi:hypothetical protein
MKKSRAFRRIEVVDVTTARIKKLIHKVGSIDGLPKTTESLSSRSPSDASVQVRRSIDHARIILTKLSDVDPSRIWASVTRNKREKDDQQRAQQFEAEVERWERQVNGGEKGPRLQSFDGLTRAS